MLFAVSALCSQCSWRPALFAVSAVCSQYSLRSVITIFHIYIYPSTARARYDQLLSHRLFSKLRTTGHGLEGRAPLLVDLGLRTCRLLAEQPEIEHGKRSSHTTNSLLSDRKTPSSVPPDPGPRKLCRTLLSLILVSHHHFEIQLEDLRLPPSHASASPFRN